MFAKTRKTCQCVYKALLERAIGTPTSNNPRCLLTAMFHRWKAISKRSSHRILFLAVGHLTDPESFGEGQKAIPLNHRNADGGNRISTYLHIFISNQYISYACLTIRFVVKPYRLPCLFIYIYMYSYPRGISWISHEYPASIPRGTA